MKHSGEPPQYKCSVCQRAFYTEQQLKVHGNLHTNVRPEQCSVCGKTYKTKKDLIAHKSKLSLAVCTCNSAGHIWTRIDNLQLMSRQSSIRTSKHLGKCCKVKFQMDVLTFKTLALIVLVRLLSRDFKIL